MDRHQSQYYHPGPSNSPDISGEGFTSTQLFMGYDEPDNYDTAQMVAVPTEFHVPSQGPSPGDGAFTGNPSIGPTGLFLPDARLLIQTLQIDTHSVYGQSQLGVRRGPDEFQFDFTNIAGPRGQTTATRLSFVHTPDGYQRESQTNSHMGQGYHGNPPATEWSNRAHPVVLAHSGAHGASNYQTHRNHLEGTHGTSQTRDQEFPLLPSSSATHPDLWQSFPLDNEDHRKKRDALNSVIQAPWKQNNELELDPSLLLQFMVLDPVEGRWYCTFWKDGRSCNCSCKKRDHARGHIRSHIDLLPFVCNGPCPSSARGCNKRYPAVEPLQKHRKGKTTCDSCGVPVLPGNMKRHIQICHTEITPAA